MNDKEEKITDFFMILLMVAVLAWAVWNVYKETRPIVPDTLTPHYEKPENDLPEFSCEGHQCDKL